jgi:hypothetical protein
MRYYDVQRHWTKRIMPHLSDPVVQVVLVNEMNAFLKARTEDTGFDQGKFHSGDVPHDHESCYWWLDHRGPMPRFWRYVRHSACHWLVTFNLLLAERAAPKQPWRIVTSDRHSTVWNGDDLLFDMNFLALGVDPDEAFHLAHEGGEVWKPGQWMLHDLPNAVRERLGLTRVAA